MVDIEMPRLFFHQLLCFDAVGLVHFLLVPFHGAKRFSLLQNKNQLNGPHAEILSHAPTCKSYADP